MNVTHLNDIRFPFRVALAAGLLAVVGAAYLLSPIGAGATGSYEVVVVKTKPLSLADLQAAAKQAREETAQLNEAVRATMTAYTAAQERQSALGIAVADARAEVGAAQSELDLQRAITSARVTDIYKTGDYSALDAIVESGDLSGWDDSVIYFRMITDQDRLAGSKLAALARQVEQTEKLIAAQREESIAVSNEIDQQRAILGDQIAQRRAILDDLVAQIKKIVAAQTSLNPNVAIRGSYTPIQWAQSLLQQLGMPLTNDNITALVAWELAEGGHWNNTAHYNPLNTTQPEPGATSMNSVGVKAYKSWAQGFEATITTLHNGRYGAILEALRRGDSATAVSQAVAGSPWGTPGFERLL